MTPEPVLFAETVVEDGEVCRRYSGPLLPSSLTSATVPCGGSLTLRVRIADDDPGETSSVSVQYGGPPK